MTAPTRTIVDYEKLRAAVLAAEPVRGPDLGTVRHRGLANWLKQPPLTPLVPQPCAGSDRRSGTVVDPAPATTELTRLIAGIVVALAMEPAHG
jgi:hypothetical protein